MYSGVVSYPAHLQLSCCGLNTGPTDWSRDTLIATFWIRNHTSDTPDSCCITPTLGCGEGVAISPNITLIHNKVISIEYL